MTDMMESTELDSAITLAAVLRRRAEAAEARELAAIEREMHMAKRAIAAEAEAQDYAEIIAKSELPIKEERERVDTLEDALHQIQQWADAYPIDIFTPVSDEELKEYAALLPRGRFDALHGSWARHITEGMKDIARIALEKDDEIG